MHHAYLGVRSLSTKVELFRGGVEVSVSSTFEVGLLAKDKVEEVVVEFVVDIDED
jgi:hypothetical protein